MILQRTTIKIIYTLILYSGSALLGKYIVLEGITKYLFAGLVWSFSIIMIKLYAPADTENVPILSKKERKQKQLFSYIVLTLEIIIAIMINNKNSITMDILYDVINKTIFDQMKDEKTSKKIPMDIILKFYLGGVLNVCIEWLKYNNKHSKQEIIDYIDLLIPKDFDK